MGALTWTLDKLFGGYVTQAGEGFVEGQARRAEARRRRRQARSTSAAAAGRALALLPPAGADDQHAGELAPNLAFSPGPMRGRPPVVLYVGVDAQRWASKGAAAATEAQGHAAALIVAPAGHHLETSHAERFPGGLEEQLVLALARADELLDGTDRYLAVVLRPPITGSFAEDAQLDLDALFAPLLTRDVWLTWLTPLDVSSWPDDVLLSGPDSPEDVRRRLSEAGLDPGRRATVLADVLRLPRREAGRALLLLAGDDEALAVHTGDAPPYDRRLQLLIGPEAERTLEARVAVDALPGAGGRLADQGWQVRFDRGTAATVVPLDTVARQVSAYRVIGNRGRLGARTGVPQSVAQSEPVSVTSAERSDGMRRLDEAILEQDPHLAMSALVRKGRAWVDSPAAEQMRPRLKATLEVFGPASAPGVWAHYLIALDAALRLERVDLGAFDEHAIARADPHRLGLLYAAEAMEFRRLAGDLDGACRQAELLLPRFTPAGQVADDDADRYVQGTSRYLVANLLRRGGQYGAARAWVDEAQLLLEGIAPSLRAEHMHCRYARGVCAGMLGEALLEPLGDSGDQELTFGRALVRLADANAAWLEGSVGRASASARRAQHGFEEIGYTRYAARARDLSELLEAWTACEREGVGAISGRVPSVVERLLDSRPSTIDLSRLRPSRALGILQFPLRFRELDVPHQVVLPSVLSLAAGHERLSVHRLPDAGSVHAANVALRDAMALPPRMLLPLLAD